MELDIYNQLALLYLEKEDTNLLTPSEFYNEFQRVRKEICEQAQKQAKKRNS